MKSFCLFISWLLFCANAGLAQTFPAAPVVEQCNRTENPIAGIWTNGLTGTGECQCDGSALAGASGTDDCYITNTVTGKFDFYFTLPAMATLNSDTNYYAYFCGQAVGLGSVSFDGYCVRLRRATAANDIVQLCEVTDAAESNIGTAYQSIEFANGDAVGVRVEPGGTIRLYFNDGGAGYSQVDVVVGETTYDCSNTVVGFRANHTSVLFDDIGLGQVGSPFMMILEAN